jgi:serine/threonine protein kinase
MTRTDDTNDPSERHPRDPRAGALRLGRYLVLGTLARGGMGEVLRARAIGAAGATKEVCVKRIRASFLGDRRAIERFVHEARLSLSLTHANIVSTFDFGRAADDYYLAMEWIDGADLSRIAKDAAAHPLRPALVAHVGAEVARALRYAHEPGPAGPDGARPRPAIVHCDVKPSNILVSRSGDVKLADFGVAVAHREGSRGGTPRYMAPELRGGDEVAGPEADLFALGVVLGELIALCPDAPSELRALVARLTREDPAERPGAAELASRLEELAALARVQGDPSPRDDLGLRAARSAPTLDAEPSELRPETSYLRDGESETETRLTATTRSAPEPPPVAAPPERRSLPRLALAAAGVVAALVVWAAWPAERAPEPLRDGPSRPTDAPAAAATRAAREASTESVGALAPRVEPGEPAGVIAALPPPPAEEPGPTLAPDPRARPARARPERHAEPPPPAPEGSEASSPPAPVAGPVAAIPVAPEPATAPAEVSPEPLADAVLRVNAIPWANVELDGRALGATPITRLELSPGAHELRFTNPVLGVSRVERVTVEPGERRDVIVTLQ